MLIGNPLWCPKKRKLLASMPDEERAKATAEGV